MGGLRLRTIGAASAVAALLSAVAVLAPAADALPAVAADSTTDPVTFGSNWSGSDWGGSVYPSNQSCPSATYTVPAGINLVRITAVGGVGAPGSDMSIDPTGKLSFLGRNGGGNGGLAAKVSGIVGVAPGTVFNVVVATNGGSPASPTRLNWAPAGGWGGGGVSTNGNAPVSGGGGGASYVTTAALVGSSDRSRTSLLGTQCKPASNWTDWGTDNTSQMTLVAAGGGGGGNASTGGDGGGGGNAGLLGGAGAGGSNGGGSAGGYGGAGGSQTSGGATGNLGADNALCSHNRSAGYFLMGGFAGHDSFSLVGSGGGGGGLWGGGAGGRSCASAGAGAGGGGSSYITPTALNQSSSLDESAVPYVRFEPILRGTTTTVAASPNPAYSNETVTLTATVTPTGGMPADLPQVPTGTVTFLEGPFNDNIGYATVVDGVATLTKTLATGSHAIRALFHSDALFGDSLSPLEALTVQVNEPPVAPAVIESPTSVTVGYGSGCGFNFGVIVSCGDNVSFTASASGYPAPARQWQVSTDNGATYANVADATGTIYSLNPPVSFSGNKYRAVFTNASGTATTTAATLTVNPAALRIRANDKWMPFGGAVPTLDATYGDPQYGAVFRNGDTAASLSGTLTCTTTATSSSGTGSYPITCSGRTSTNYTITYVAGTLTVQPAVQTIVASTSAPSHAFVGGSYTPAVTGGASGNPVTITIDSADSTAGVCRVANGVVHFDSAGLYGIGHCYINFNQAGDGVYPAAAQVQQHAVVYEVPPAVTLQPVSQTVNYGDSVTFASVATGTAMWIQWYVSGDGGVTFQPELGASSADLTFTPQTWQSGNRYKVAYTNQTGPSTVQTAWSDVVTLTVLDPLTFTLQPSDPPYPVLDCCGYTTTTGFGAVVTGSPKPTAQWQISTDGGTTFTDIAGATSVESYWAGGWYSGYQLTARGSDNGNVFRVAFTNPQGTIYSDAATLTVWYLVSITGQPAAQTVHAGDTASFTAAASGSPVPTVQWQVSTDGGQFFSNVDGATSPTLSLTDVTVAMDGNRYRAVFTNPNRYRIGFALYETSTATTDAVTLTVYGPPTVTTDPVDVALAAGETATFTAAADGALASTVGWQVSTDGGDSWSAVTGATGTTLSFATTGTQDGNQYRAAFTNAAGTSYTDAATLTVDLNPLTVTADEASMTYGDSVPTLAASYGGFVNDDDPSLLTGTLECAAAATDVGDHAIDCSGLSSPDYAITYVAGTLHVNPAPLIIAVTGSQTYGGLPSYAVTGVTGLVNADDDEVVTGSLACSSEATASSDVAAYDITTCSGFGAANYSVGYDLGSVIVTAAPLTVTASSISSTYGTTPPAVSPAYAGFVNGDSPSSLDVAPRCTTTVTKPTAVGSYPGADTCTGGADGNYAISYVPGSATVTQAVLTVAANNQSRLFGAANPALTTTVTGFANAQTLASSGVTGAALCTTNATAASVGGSYPITCTGGSLQATNYSFAFVPGTLTIGYSGGSCLTGATTKKLVVSSGQAVCLGAGFSTTAPVIVEAGGALNVAGGSTTVNIRAALTITGARSVRLCGMNLTAPLSISGTTGLVTVGSTGTPACTGNAISAPVTIRSNAGGVVFKNNVVSGSLTISGTTGSVPSPDSGSVAVSGNRISGRTTIS